MKAVNIRVEHLTNPIGIDVTSPLITWIVEGCIKQTAYQIVAKCGDDTVWDSNKVYSSSMKALFQGPLKSRDRIDLHITLWDENNERGLASQAFFEMGLLDPSDFKAKWISGDYNPKKKVRYPVDCFKKEFKANNIVKARLYATACGIYVAQLNGTRVSDFVLAPGVTDYNKRIQYQTYDVTEYINNGENELVFELADGWYRGSTGAWGIRNQYGTKTKLFAQLELVDSRGNVTWVSSDDTFSWSNDGPITFADNKDGERVDANKVASFNGKARLTSHKVLPTASNNVPIVEKEVFEAKLIKTPKGDSVLDFSQNIAGYISFKLKAKKGQEVLLRFAEMLDSEGEFTQKNFQLSNKRITTPLQEIRYIAKEGLNEYKTKFSIFGFQYVLVETDIDFKAEDFKAIAVYSDLKTTFSFDSSNPLLNKFVEITKWSAKGNFADNLTDCPTRERHGWTGDAQIFSNTAIYMFDFNAFARKYIQDMYDWQKRSGRLPQIVPPGGVDFYMATMNGSVGWADAGVMMPYRLWKGYGDEAVISKYYDQMKKYAEFMMRRCGRKAILSKPLHLKSKDRRFAVNYGQSYGEWAEPKDVFPMTWVDIMFPHPEVSTAYTCYVMELMEEIALHLDKTEDAKLYRKYIDGTRGSYQAIRETKAYPLDTDRQAELVRPLYFKLLDKDKTEYAKNRLIEAMENYDWRLGTGFLSTPLILYVLADIDIEYAYGLLENEKMPGWLFMPKSGATTVWESWEGTSAQSSIASLNHYSKGAVCEWLFTTMCGIRIEGENKFLITPKPGGKFTYASFVYDSIYGQVSSKWERRDNNIIYTFTLPSNTSASLELPDGSTHELTPGEHSFTCSE